MSLERVVGVTVALLLLGNVAVKKTDNIQVRQDADKTAIVQLADVVSDAFAADVALAGDDPNYGDREFADANALWRELKYSDAIDLMERVVDANPLNQKFASGLFQLYKKSGAASNAAEFFNGFVDINKETLAQKPAMNKLYAKGIYDIAVQAMYTTIPGICKNQQRNPSFDMYEPVVQLLEKAVELQPAKIPKGDELFWANTHYELGWGYRRFSTLGSLEESPSWSKKSVDEHITSVKIGGKKFVQSKRDRTPIGFTDARGNLPLYELIAKIDPHPIWKKALEEEKAMERVYGK